MPGTAGFRKKRHSRGVNGPASPGGLDRFAKIDEPRQDPENIRIHHRHAAIKRKRRNSRGRVGTDPGKPSQRLHIPGHASTVLANHRLRGLLEVSGAGVISQAFPAFQNVPLVRSRECGGRWKNLHPPPEKRNHRCDGRLLQHEFGHQHGVRIRMPPPRQIPPVAVEPPVKITTKRSGIGNHLDSPIEYAPNRGMSSEKKLHSHTAPLTTGQADLLRKALKARGFEFEEKPYTLFAARKDRLNVAVYEKGPKVLLQGRGLEEFITFVLEPEVLGEAKFGYEEIHTPELFEPHFGIDESGKGDFFGPLVIAGVYVDAPLARALRDAGVQDSKAIGSDKKIRDLAKAIRDLRAPQSVVVISPLRYNELYRKIGNLNRLLAWGHARVIENLCEMRPDCPRALSDKFADVRVLEKALLAKGRGIQLDQRTKAESDFAVAAASILAREKFINWLDDTGKSLGLPLPRGVSAAVKSSARALVGRDGAAALEQFAKTHFKTAAEITGGL